MRRSISYFLFALSGYIPGQVLTQCDKNDPSLINIKWYTPQLVSSLRFNVFRSESAEGNWIRLNSEPLKFKKYRISPDSLKKDKELLQYVSMLEKTELKGLVLLAVLLKSFKSAEFSKHLGILFIDSTAVRGTAYTYKITQIEGSSEKPIGVSGSIESFTYKRIAAPNEIHAQLKEQHAILNWRSEPTRYYGMNIYRKENDTSVFQKINRTPVLPTGNERSESEYADVQTRAGTTYTYILRGLDFFGGLSEPSEPLILKIKDVQPPKAPSGLTCTVKGKVVIVSWKADERDVAGFNVYRSGTDEKQLIKINSAPLNSGTREFRDSVPAFQSYSYFVASSDSSANESRSMPANCEVFDNEAPSRPAELTASADTGRISLRWRANPESDIKGYLIYRAVGNSSYVRLTAEPVGDSFYKDDFHPSVKNTLLYKIAAVDHTLNKSEFSKEVRVQLPDVIAPSPPFISKAGPTEKNELMIEWFSNPERDLKGYELLRNEGTEEFKKINIKIIPRSINKYTDRSVTEGRLYTYYLRAIDSTGNVSSASNKTKARIISETDTVRTLRITRSDYQKSKNQVIIRWKLNEPEGIRGFVVYRLAPAESEFRQLTVLTKENSINDKDLIAGVYRYQVRAYTFSGDVIRSEKISIEIKESDHEK
jgi:uncharacterized protein